MAGSVNKIVEYLTEKNIDFLEEHSIPFNFLLEKLDLKSIKECSDEKAYLLYVITIELLLKEEYGFLNDYYDIIDIEEAILETDTEEIITEFVNGYLAKENKSYFENVYVDDENFIVSDQQTLREDFIIKIIANEVALKMEVELLKIKFELQQTVKKEEWYELFEINEEDEQEKENCEYRLFSVLDLKY